MSCGCPGPDGLLACCILWQLAWAAKASTISAPAPTTPICLMIWKAMTTCAFARLGGSYFLVEVWQSMKIMRELPGIHHACATNRRGQSLPHWTLGRNQKASASLLAREKGPARFSGEQTQRFKSGAHGCIGSVLYTGIGVYRM